MLGHEGVAGTAFFGGPKMSAHFFPWGETMDRNKTGNCPHRRYLLQ